MTHRCRATPTDSATIHRSGHMYEVRRDADASPACRPRRRDLAPGGPIVQWLVKVAIVIGGGEFVKGAVGRDLEPKQRRRAPQHRPVHPAVRAAPDLATPNCR